MRDVANPIEGLPYEARQDRRRALPLKRMPPRAHKASVPMDTFKWVVSGLLGALALGAGWFLSSIQADLRDVRKEVSGMRIEAAVTNTRLEELIAEFRRRNPR
ncbi:MAG: hypothetical protein K2X72_04370 [Reyranella sp.]|nr:hypothetical protein [Reyranella sp.]